MDVNKVLGVAEELIEEESELNIQTLLNNLLSYVNTNNGTEADKIFEQLDQAASQSITLEYAPSKSKILLQLNSNEFFGSGLKKSLENMFTTETYKTKDRLSKFITSRQMLLTELKSLNESLTALNFESYYDDLSSYELGLLIPDNRADLKKVKDYLADWHFILRQYSELCAKDNAEPRVYSVSSSSVGVYILGGWFLINELLKTCERITKIYESVQRARKAKQEMEYFKLKKDAIIEMEKKIEAQVAEGINQIVKEVIETHKGNIDPNRKTHITSAIKRSVERIVRMMDEGLIIEATSPKIEKPEILDEAESEANKKERDASKKDYDKQIANKNNVLKSVAQVAKTVKELASAGKEVLQIGQYIKKDEELETAPKE